MKLSTAGAELEPAVAWCSLNHKRSHHVALRAPFILALGFNVETSDKCRSHHLIGTLLICYHPVEMKSAPRERAMPLVPEPFEQLSVGTRPVSGDIEPLAPKWGLFCPNLDIPQYREPLSKEKKTELDKRAVKLYRRAIVNQLYKSSEFGWEVCAWHDVFGLVMDDQALRMDKRPYEYVATDDDGQRFVKTRIPDATLGLTAYDTFDFNFSRDHVCTGPDCDVDHKTEPDTRLSQDRLVAMMHTPECGLVVDGSWGNADIVFPFAAYEAKKRTISYEAARHQIHHACRTYLAMLDDLVRNPDNVAEYQTENSSKYQFFALTSCGSYWEVYLAWNFLDRCVSLIDPESTCIAHHGIPFAYMYIQQHVETIWEGDVKEFSRAFDLICIVDQIHDYALNVHRPFVMQHLEAWHARHEKFLEPEGPSPDTLRAANYGDGSAGMGSGATNGGNSHGFNRPIQIEKILNLAGFGKKPEWFNLKRASLERRTDKAQMTREHNRDLRNFARIRRVMDAGLRPAQTEATNGGRKRGQGRPRKTDNKVVKVTVAQSSSGGTRRSARLQAKGG
ncbi:hypothetical protein F5144DRAFT_352850 [Chaetomium tenue]|uniref:Uncharacterized protein n=1 Tax=Chaetomium tenue TaxID=1854479 RepID=A0ACB7NZP3_9PEZI|nr:hypothetical protein F5144DRAFT_352850 [Chaetomium globosum]